ncbi:hypothetical protein, partial [Streptomyces sp. NPDC002346]
MQDRTVPHRGVDDPDRDAAVDAQLLARHLPGPGGEHRGHQARSGTRVLGCRHAKGPLDWLARDFEELG